MELQGCAQARTSGYSAPARRPKFRESCLRVCRYVASIRLSLGFPAPIPIGPRGDIWRTHDASPPVRPIPRHILSPFPPSNPIGFPLICWRTLGTDLLSCCRRATPERQTSRMSPSRPSTTMVRTPSMPKIPSRARGERAPGASPEPHLAISAMTACRFQNPPNSLPPSSASLPLPFTCLRSC